MRSWLSPRLLGAHLIALVCVGVAVGFGVWQYDAWKERRAAEQLDLTTAQPIGLDHALGPDDPFPGQRVGQPVRVGGTWLPEGTVLIEGRETGAGNVGYWVVTPLTHGGPEDSAVPVVRGWTAEQDDVPPPPEGEAELVGWLQPPEGTGARDDDPTDDVLPQLRVADLVQRVDNDLYAAYVVLDPEATTDLGGTNTGTADLAVAGLDQLPEVSTFTGLRNILYALEWFVFAGFAAFLWWRHVRDVLAHDDLTAAAEGEESDAPADAAPQPFDG